MVDPVFCNPDGPNLQLVSTTTTATTTTPSSTTTTSIDSSSPDCPHSGLSDEEVFAANMSIHGLAPDQATGNFTLDLCRLVTVRTLRLQNTRGGEARDRATQEFRVHLGTSTTGPWTEALHKVLPDPRRMEDPLPVLDFPIAPTEARFARFELVSHYGRGGGLQHFSALPDLTSTPPSTPCGPGWAQMGDSCYLVVKKPMIWTEARQVCIHTFTILKLNQLHYCYNDRNLGEAILKSLRFLKLLDLSEFVFAHSGRSLTCVEQCNVAKEFFFIRFLPMSPNFAYCLASWERADLCTTTYSIL